MQPLRLGGSFTLRESVSDALGSSFPTKMDLPGNLSEEVPATIFHFPRKLRKTACCLDPASFTVDL
jgi:hypothetical protein